MRTLVVAMLLCTMNMVQAQTDPYRSQINVVFANVNKSLVPTGFLEEYASPLLPLDVFQGVLTDSNKVNMDAWRLVYTTLHTSRIYGTNPLPTLDVVNSTITQQQNNYGAYTLAANAVLPPANAAIPVTMLYADYNYIRSDAVTANLLRVQSNVLYDVAGRTQSPYYSRKLFVASPTLNWSNTGTVSLIFKQELFYKASSKIFSTLQVDFTDGLGYRTATWNNAISATYTATGKKYVKIKITFTDGTIMQCYAVLDIREVANAQARFANDEAVIQPFAATANHAGGRVFVDLSVTNGTGRIRRPLIVVEGYDVSSTAPDLQSNYNYEDFLEDINIRFIDFRNFNEQLDDVAGYDLIFLDYTNGTDDIRRNAALLQEVITWVNQQKALGGSAEQNVVMGISMGGLVARYALADMTKRSINPQTRLLITHDSPHRGANTPLGTQFLTRAMNELVLATGTGNAGVVPFLFNKIFPQISQGNALLDAPASQQMLIVRATSSTQSVTNTFLNNEYRTMITFGATGPQPAYQFIATSQGSECGNGPLAPGANLVTLNGTLLGGILPWISRGGYRMETIVNALPNQGQSILLSKFKVWVTQRILSLININVTLVLKQANSPTNLLPWDGAPGGTQNIQDQVADEIPSEDYNFHQFFQFSINGTYAGDFCFVPTVSALDVTTLDLASLSRAYVGGISPANPSRVNNFIAQERVNATAFNRSHTVFTARQAEWLFNEMQGINNGTRNCSADCSINYAAGMSGPDLVCSSSAFTVTNNVGAFPIAWSSSYPDGLSINSSGIASPVGKYSGSVTLSAVIQGTCGNSNPIAKTVWVSKPVKPGGLLLVVEPCLIDAAINASGGTDFYNWYIDYGLVDPGNESTFFSISLRDYPLSIGSHVIKVEAVNSCGTSAQLIKTFNITNQCEGGTYALAYPNPVQDQLTVNTTLDGTDEEPAVVALVDEFNETVYSKTTTEKEVILKLSSLREGIYTLKITRATQSYQQRILVTKN